MGNTARSPGPVPAVSNLTYAAPVPTFGSEDAVMKRLKLLYPDDRPTDAPDVVWMPDAVGLDVIAERVPGAVGYLDLDSGDLEVRPGAIDPAAISAQLGGTPRPGSPPGRGRASR